MPLLIFLASIMYCQLSFYFLYRRDERVETFSSEIETDAVMTLGRFLPSCQSSFIALHLIVTTGT
jgi:hypothetical protein